MRFQVITAIPPGGCLAANPEVYQVTQLGGLSQPERVRPLDPLVSLFTLRTPVFHVGEVLIVDEDGREIGWPQRKPAKWDLTFEEFDDLGLALARARSLLEGGILS